LELLKLTEVKGKEQAVEYVVEESTVYNVADESMDRFVTGDATKVKYMENSVQVTSATELDVYIDNSLGMFVQVADMLQINGFMESNFTRVITLDIQTIE